LSAIQTKRKSCGKFITERTPNVTIRNSWKLLSRLLLLAAATAFPLACSDHETERADERSRAKAAGAEQAAEKDEAEAQPEAADIGEDCVAFLRSTRTSAVPQPNKQCPTCPPGETAAEVLKFEGYQQDKISCSGSTCEVTVTIRAQFNPGKGGAIVGGLVGWIPLEQREQYARGQTPVGEQFYQVQITYRRTEDGWQPVEFDRVKD
jgi:hypothetical protein